MIEADDEPRNIPERSPKTGGMTQTAKKPDGELKKLVGETDRSRRNGPKTAKRSDSELRNSLERMPKIEMA